jgi:hypothetical protein
MSLGGDRGYHDADQGSAISFVDRFAAWLRHGPGEEACRASLRDSWRGDRPRALPVTPARSRSSITPGTAWARHRDYDPAIGRYVRSDPIGLTGGINTYGYVFQNPLLRVDSLGLYAYGHIISFWNHYCDGSGAATATSFASINWGDTDLRALATIESMIGANCDDRTISVAFNMGTKAAGADRWIIGRHVVKSEGELRVHCDCTWTYSGSLSSALGYDPYDFDVSNRGLIGDANAWIGRNRCTGKSFDIHLTGSKPVTASGTVKGGSSACCR